MGRRSDTRFRTRLAGRAWERRPSKPATRPYGLASPMRMPVPCSRGSPRRGHLVRLRRGLWALPDRVDPLTLPGRLTAPLPSYVSLQSALCLHGIISQVPTITYAVSLARARQYTTPLGVISVHHVVPGFFFGFEEAGRQGAQVASPEKALVDFLYLGPARSKLFRALPEVELPRGFSARRARAITARIESSRRRTMVQRALDRLLEGKPPGG